ncbi:unnamed protein product, partial [Brassica oleracea]
MGNIFSYFTTGWRSNVPPATDTTTVQPRSHSATKTKTTTVQPRSHSQSVVNQSVSSASRSYYSAHSSPRTESYRGGASRHKTAKKIRQK